MSKKQPKDGIKELIENGESTKITEQNLENWLAISKERVDKLWDQVTTPSNNPLMILLEEKKLLKIHNVYLHISQEGEVVYVGIGSGGRSDEATLRRDKDHGRWMVQQTLNGYDYVHVVHKQLTEIQAREAETFLINKLKPRFNKAGK